jgi:hypothetical protein
MLRTRDGYSVTMPRFRVRRLRRRLKTRGRDRLGERGAARLVGTLVGRAMRASPSPARYPVFTSNIGLQRMLLVTRAIAPRRVELLYIRRSS